MHEIRNYDEYKKVDTFKLATLKGTIETADGNTVEIEFVGPKRVKVTREEEEIRYWPQNFAIHHNLSYKVELEVEQDPQTGHFYIVRLNGVK